MWWIKISKTANVAHAYTVQVMSDDNLYGNVLNNENHVLHKLRPERSTHDYNLRPWSHDRSLSVRTDNKKLF